MHVRDGHLLDIKLRWTNERTATPARKLESCVLRPSRLIPLVDLIVQTLTLPAFPAKRLVASL